MKVCSLFCRLFIIHLLIIICENLGFLNEAIFILCIYLSINIFFFENSTLFSLFKFLITKIHFLLEKFNNQSWLKESHIKKKNQKRNDFSLPFEGEKLVCRLIYDKKKSDRNKLERGR